MRPTCNLNQNEKNIENFRPQRNWCAVQTTNLEKTRHPCKHYEEKNYGSQNNHTKTTCMCSIDTSASNKTSLKRHKDELYHF
jgi:hypothetical protein